MSPLPAVMAALALLLLYVLNIHSRRACIDCNGTGESDAHPGSACPVCKGEGAL